MVFKHQVFTVAVMRTKINKYFSSHNLILDTGKDLW